MKKNKKERTWTFQPAEDVRQAVLDHFKVTDMAEISRGERTKLINDAMRQKLPDEIRRIWEARRREEDAKLGINSDLERTGGKSSHQDTFRPRLERNFDQALEEIQRPRQPKRQSKRGDAR